MAVLFRQAARRHASTLVWPLALSVLFHLVLLAEVRDWAKPGNDRDKLVRPISEVRLVDPNDSVKRNEVGQSNTAHQGEPDGVPTTALQGAGKAKDAAVRASGQRAPIAPQEKSHLGRAVIESTQALADDVAPDALRRYRIALGREARRFRSYPNLAKERGWEGSSEVHIRLSDVDTPRVTLGSSSGFSELDDQALEMIRRSVAIVSKPPEFSRRAVLVVVPVRFSLTD